MKKPLQINKIKNTGTGVCLLTLYLQVEFVNPENFNEY